MCDGVQLSQLCMPNIALGIPALAHGRKSKRACYASLGMSLNTLFTRFAAFCCASAFLSVVPQLLRQSVNVLMTNLRGGLHQGKVEQVLDTSVPRIAGNIFEVMRSFPQECVPKRIGEQLVDVVVP